MIGGLGSIAGSAIAAVVVGLVQQYANYYASSRALGDLSVRPAARGGAARAARAASPERSRREQAQSHRGLRLAARRLRRARVRPAARGRHPEALRLGRLDSPGTLQLLALCLLFGGLALTYDLLFGFTGLLSFGHALYFAVGAYMATSR